MRVSGLARISSIFVVAALVVSACSGDGDVGFGPAPDSTTAQIDDDTGGSDATGSGSEADLEAAATESFAAVLRADNQAYFNLLSRTCRNLQFAAVEGHLDGRRFRIDSAGIDRSALGVGGVEIRDFDGSAADVIITVSGTTESFLEATPRRWIFQDNGWKLDECDEITPAQGGLAGVGTDRNNPLVLGGVTDISGWLVSLRFVDLDAETLVTDLGGPPAPAGTQFVAAQIGLDYIGAEPIVTLGDGLGFAIVSGDTAYGQDTACATGNDAFLDLSAQAAPGDTLAPVFVCRALSAGDVGDALLRVTHTPTGTDYWFDLG
jgi:hypothetical protein